ncbi:MAG: type III pantothenate kinase [Gemmatimonadota bacterium]|jgi:type III pantothenate kinase|nr:type III pantothenate kinase [Gemmatimonadota bacterium]
MLLVFDVGNTETTVGLCEGEAVRHHWRLTTEPSRTPDELAVQLGGLLAMADIVPGAITGAAIGSVVPALTHPLAEACRRLPGVEPVVVDASSPLPIRLEVDEPHTVGADRIINTLAASRRFGVDCIVVDLGTATTYDCITADGVFHGGIIQPGIRTSAETLFRRAARLSATELVAPARAMGKRTDLCIRAGVMFGAAASIDGLVARLKAEWPTAQVPRVIATGGLASAIQPLCQSIDRVEPDLTLEGLAMAHALLAGRGRSLR